MPDNWRFSDEEMEQGLRDLGAGIEYPPTPDVARTVSRKLDEERPRAAGRTRRWPRFLAPRWTAVAAALVLVAVALCPSPSMEAIPARAAAGATFRLRGQSFSSGCNKTRPARDVEIHFRQDGKIRKLATLEANRNLAFNARLRVPENARPGRAILSANTRSGEHVKTSFSVIP